MSHRLTLRDRLAWLAGLLARIPRWIRHPCAGCGKRISVRDWDVLVFDLYTIGGYRESQTYWHMACWKTEFGEWEAF